MKNLDKFLSLLNADMDGLLLTSRYARHYAAEFDIAEGMAVVSANGCRYFTDSRYIESAQANISGFEVLQMDMQNPYEKRINEAIADFAIENQSLIAFAQSLSITPEQLGMKLGMLFGMLFPLVGIAIYGVFVKQHKSKI